MHEFIAGLLLQGDKSVQLVALCAEKPTVALLKRIAIELPVQLKKITDEHQYAVSIAIEESAVLVTDDTITVKVFLTSPLLRDPQGIYLKTHLTLWCVYHQYVFAFLKQKIYKQIASQSRCDIDHG